MTIVAPAPLQAAQHCTAGAPVPQALPFKAQERRRTEAAFAAQPLTVGDAVNPGAYHNVSELLQRMGRKPARGTGTGTYGLDFEWNAAQRVYGLQRGTKCEAHSLQHQALDAQAGAAARQQGHQHLMTELLPGALPFQWMLAGAGDGCHSRPIRRSDSYAEAF